MESLEESVKGKVDVHESERRLKIVFNWIDRGKIFYNVSSLILSGGVAISVWFSYMMSDDDFLDSLGQVPDWILLIVFLFIFITIFYGTVADFINITTVTIKRGGEVEIEHSPLPWPGLKVIKVDTIRHTFINDEKRFRGPRVYFFYFIINKGKMIKPFPPQSMPEPALYIKERIDAYLGLEKE